MKTMRINKSQLKKLVGVVFGQEGWDNYKNIVVGYIDDIQIFISTNLNQDQWDKFCDGRLSESELLKSI